MRKRFGYFSLFALLLAISVAYLTPPARAFVVTVSGRAPEDPVEALNYAARWHANKLSLVESGERGLGGGLEFSVEDGFCDKLEFVDPEWRLRGFDVCELVRAIIVESGKKWAAGNPVLELVDVTEHIPAESDYGKRTEGVGAEVDFLVIDRASATERGLTSDTQAFALTSSSLRAPTSTNGKILRDAATVTSSDIYLVTDRCYYIIHPGTRGGCIHFALLVMHELGHFYGLDHPDEEPERNMDSDGNPRTSVVIDCSDPKLNLRQSSSVDETSYLYTLGSSGTLRKGVEIGRRDRPLTTEQGWRFSIQFARRRNFSRFATLPKTRCQPKITRPSYHPSPIYWLSLSSTIFLPNP